MPCNCTKPDPKYPTNLEWGPAFWGIIHSLAQSAGRLGHSTILQADERKHWTAIFSELSDTLPCDDCRGHYRVLLSGISLGSIKTMPYAELGPFIKHTWWDWHNQVNARLGKEALPFENLDTTYSGNSVRILLKGVTPTIEIAIKMSGVRIMAWKNFVKSVIYLMGTYGIV